MSSKWQVIKCVKGTRVGRVIATCVDELSADRSIKHYSWDKNHDYIKKEVRGDDAN